MITRQLKSKAMYCATKAGVYGTMGAAAVFSLCIPILYLLPLCLQSYFSFVSALLLAPTAGLFFLSLLFDSFDVRLPFIASNCDGDVGTVAIVLCSWSSSVTSHNSILQHPSFGSGTMTHCSCIAIVWFFFGQRGSHLTGSLGDTHLQILSQPSSIRSLIEYFLPLNVQKSSISRCSIASSVAGVVESNSLRPKWKYLFKILSIIKNKITK